MHFWSVFKSLMLQWPWDTQVGLESFAKTVVKAYFAPPPLTESSLTLNSQSFHLSLLQSEINLPWTVPTSPNSHQDSKLACTDAEHEHLTALSEETEPRSAFAQCCLWSEKVGCSWDLSTFRLNTKRRFQKPHRLTVSDKVPEHVSWEPPKAEKPWEGQTDPSVGKISRCPGDLAALDFQASVNNRHMRKFERRESQTRECRFCLSF